MTEMLEMIRTKMFWFRELIVPPNMTLGTSKAERRHNVACPQKEELYGKEMRGTATGSQQ